MSDVPQPATETRISVYVGPALDSLRSIVSSLFFVKDAFLDPNGIPTIQIATEPVKTKFKQLLEQLSQHQLVAAIRGTGDTLTIKVFQKPPRKPSRKVINVILFAATVVTVFLAGYFIWEGFREALGVFAPAANPYTMGLEFAVGLLAIIGLHEFGHQAAARYHKLDATLPYFIPFPPPIAAIGTFGAVISLKEPPANRDELFDLGLSGPVVGFVVTIAVGLMWIASGISLTAAQINMLGAQGLLAPGDWPNQPAILILLENLTNFLRPDVGANGLIYSQLFFAAKIGCLLTFLNIVPAWQLDGGHISRAAFGPYGHRIATIAGIIGLLIAKYYTFALMILMFMAFSRRGFAGVEPLDDISGISNSRKFLYVLALVTLGLTFSYPSF